MSLQTLPKKAMRNHALNFLKGIGCIAVVLIHVKFLFSFMQAPFYHKR